MDPGDLVRRTRRTRALGQADLARRAGTTQNYVSRIERGAVSPSTATLARLMHAMGQRLVLGSEPLPIGNVSRAELRASLDTLSASGRLEEAMELSEFATGLAEAGAAGRGR